MHNQDAGQIWREHSFESPLVNRWIETLGPEVDEIRAGTEIRAINGTFIPKHRPAYQYEWLFAPDERGETAIAVPIYNDEIIIDIAVFDIGGEPTTWGLVTDAGQFLNQRAISVGTRPLRIHRKWWSWFYFGCDGVVPLNHDCLAELHRAGDVLAEDSFHALQIFWHAYRWPKRDSDEGRRRIYIDDDADSLIEQETKKEVSNFERNAA